MTDNQFKIFKALLVEDEPYVRADFKYLLAKYPQIQIVKEVESVDDAKKAVGDYFFDLVFLDIKIHGGSGFDIIKNLKPETEIIFLTSFEEYAVKAFDVDALDYLVKPVEPVRLDKAIKRFEEKKLVKADSPDVKDNFDSLWIKSDGNKIYIEVKNITAITSFGGNFTTLITCDGNNYLVRRTLNEWEVILLKFNLNILRIHRKTLVNMNFASRLIQQKDGNYILFLTTIEDSFSVSRRSVSRVSKYLAS
ncbi:MAG: response regulator transcription factor [Deltaproteobacteria bacterium]|nr:response regulator transcription factor [Deltaproteobacteria bacterium]